jgi:hypothetical protein
MIQTYHDRLPQSDQDEWRTWIVEQLLQAYMAEEFTATDFGGILTYCLHDEWSEDPVWKELHRMYFAYLNLPTNKFGGFQTLRRRRSRGPFQARAGSGIAPTLGAPVQHLPSRFPRQSPEGHAVQFGVLTKRWLPAWSRSRRLYGNCRGFPMEGHNIRCSGHNTYDSRLSN